MARSNLRADDDTSREQKQPKSKPVAGDEHMGAFVYCASHLRPHATGWCTVNAFDKIPLGATRGEDAYAECKRLGFYLYDGNRSAAERPDGAAFPLMHRLANACAERHYRSWLTPEPLRGNRDEWLRQLAAIKASAEVAR